MKRQHKTDEELKGETFYGELYDGATELLEAVTEWLNSEPEEGHNVIGIFFDTLYLGAPYCTVIYERMT